MEKEMFIEMMAHIMTIEDLLLARYNISNEEFNEEKSKNKESIKEQLK